MLLLLQLLQLLLLLQQLLLLLGKKEKKQFVFHTGGLTPNGLLRVGSGSRAETSA